MAAIDSLEATAHLLPIYEWMEANKERLIESEREMVQKAWVQGNTEGWEMNSDWPEHGFEYYDENYG